MAASARGAGPPAREADRRSASACPSASVDLPAEADRGCSAQAMVDRRWRAQRERRQEAVLPPGGGLVTCSAVPGAGGLGRHLQEILDAFARRGERVDCLCGPSAAELTGAPGVSVQRGSRDAALLAGGGMAMARIGARAAAAPARVSPAWRAWRANVEFDLAAAASRRQVEQLVAFAGQALAQLRGARRAATSVRAVMSATAHIASVERQHALARSRHPIEPAWSGRLQRRSLLEYGEAQRIYVSSDYALQSFLEAGVPAERMALFPLTPAARFAPTGAPSVGTFDVVYVGGLSVVKGTPVLLDAFARLPHRDLRLLLVGGPETRGMRRHLALARARDARIVVCPGDPLKALRQAQLYVHPSYSDGFGYAPAEALACGVPAIVSEDTGMKELIAAGLPGLVLATGEVDALAEAIDCAYRGELTELRRADAARGR